jgi:hypothetical protein
VKKAIGFYPSPDVDTAGTQVVSHAGAVLLTESIGRVGLDQALSTALASWRPRLATHDPAKVLLDLALGLAVGGDCLADVGVLRAEPGVFGLVASDPTVSRLITALAADIDASLPAIRAAVARARAAVWARRRPLSGRAGCRDGGQVIVDIDARLVGAHSDKPTPGWSTRLGSQPWKQSRPRSRPSRRRRGGQRSTPTATRARAPRLPN